MLTNYRREFTQRLEIPILEGEEAYGWLFNVKQGFTAARNRIHEEETLSETAKLPRGHASTSYQFGVLQILNAIRLSFVKANL